jgi:adenylate cyclase
VETGRDTRRISYRVSLLVVIPVMVALTGGVIALLTFQSGRNAVEELSRSLFGVVSQQAAAMTRAELRRAVPVSESLRRFKDDGLLGDDWLPTARVLDATLRANPELSWVSLSDDGGSFIGAFHSTTGAFRLNHSVVGADGHTEMFEDDVDDTGHLTQVRHELDRGYDPRTRPFWTLAKERRARVWTPPYVFFDQGVPGITCATPVFDAKGTMRDVFTVDSDLNSLGDLVRSLKVSPGGRVFLYTQDGIVVAHPSVTLVEKTGEGANGRLVRADEIDDPVARAFFAKATELGLDAKREDARAERKRDDKPAEFSFTSGGTRYLASHTAFTIDENLTWAVAVFAPESDFMDAVRKNNLISLLVSLGMLLLAIPFTLWLSNRVARPLTRLAHEMDEVGRFELGDRPLASSWFREISQMNAALLRMKQGLRSFGSYVPKDLVRSVLASGQEAVLGGRTKELTIFFSDIAGFTTLAETMKPDALVALLGDYLGEMTGVIASRKGTVDKFIGDGIMAFWGAPAELAEHATSACGAALECAARLRSIAAGDTKAAAWANKLQTRIGIATGEVLVGNIGTPERMNYTVIGDTANLAARLEGLNKVYGTKILVSEATRVAAGDALVFRPVDVVMVKGKSQGVKVYEVLALGTETTGDARKIAELSEQALAAYVARDFARAISLWESVLGLRPGDPAALVMLERAREYASAPPTSSAWTGVYVAESK